MDHRSYKKCKQFVRIPTRKEKLRSETQYFYLEKTITTRPEQHQTQSGQKAREKKRNTYQAWIKSRHTNGTAFDF
ncbi:hypothetical protein OA79_11710 [Marinomonas sp. TW1]|nr:hypothetical protein OA79_11710 [Marinomonas sp. TW1]